jgi:hypothetical protein
MFEASRVGGSGVVSRFALVLLAILLTLSCAGRGDSVRYIQDANARHSEAARQLANAQIPLPQSAEVQFVAIRTTGLVTGEVFTVFSIPTGEFQQFMNEADLRKSGPELGGKILTDWPHRTSDAPLTLPKHYELTKGTRDQPVRTSSTLRVYAAEDDGRTRIFVWSSY